MSKFSDIYNIDGKPQRKVPAAAATAPPSVRRSPGRTYRISRRNYAMGEYSRITNDFYSGNQTADQVIFSTFARMRGRAQWLERNSDIVRKFLIMAKTNVIGAKGIRLQSLASDLRNGKLIPSKFDRQLIEDAYLDASKAINWSLDQRLSRRLSAQVALQRIIVDGECIRRRIRGADNKYGFTTQLIDPVLLDHNLNRPAENGKNEIRMGVEIDSAGRHVAYHFLKRPAHVWGSIPTYGRDHIRIAGDEIDHIFIQERPGQTRGVTWLAPAGLRAKMLDGIELAVSVGYRVAAAKMGFFVKNDQYVPGEDGDDYELETPQDVAPGEFWELPQGYDFRDFNPDYPNANYDDFVKTTIRQIASGLGVSYPELGNDYKGVSYSAGQIGVQSDIAFWSDLQQFLIETFEEPAFDDWLVMAITSGALPLPISKLEKFRRVKWQPPRRKHIDPLKTHKAQTIALGDMSRDPYDIAAENGADFEDVVENFARAKALLEEHGLPIPASWGGKTNMEMWQEEEPEEETAG